MRKTKIHNLKLKRIIHKIRKNKNILQQLNDTSILKKSKLVGELIEFNSIHWKLYKYKKYYILQVEWEDENNITKTKYFKIKLR
jgi:hypothetical protein